MAEKSGALACQGALRASHGAYHAADRLGDYASVLAARLGDRIIGLANRIGAEDQEARSQRS